MIKTSLDITPSPRLLQVLGDIPLQPWQCLAELVDNSLDELVKQPDRTVDDPLVIDIRIVGTGPTGTYLEVSDNGLGMSAEELERALRAGHSAKNRYGTLGLFGMGFNIATARLGSITTVSTTQSGSGELLQTTIDFSDIQRRESFSVPLERMQASVNETGTTVRVLLKRDMAENLRRPATQRTLMSQLGDVYSFLLRDGVPGISVPDMSARMPASLRFNGEPVTAKLPCIWSDQRSVTSYGQKIAAVQYIDTKLTAATACLDCGYWDRKNGPEECEECGSRNLDLRERRVWGWLGIQRYIDSTSFGVDFIRYGRKILKQDKSIFTFTDPDTLQTDAEYPIEMPANQGRIVGEIHLDHVPVTYQKNDFDRQSNDWQKAIEIVRGSGPLKPKGAREVNDSPLAKLYSAFRRNDPGLRYLVPGDGTRALHTKAREWASLFDKGIPRMLDDGEWYEAARRHQDMKDGGEDAQSGSADKSDGTGAIGRLVGVPSGDQVPKETKEPTAQYDVLEAARLLGTSRDDLSGYFKLGSDLGDWTISVIATRDTLKDGDMAVPSITGIVKGRSVEVLVASEHPIFREYGRDIRDVALLHAASVIKDLASTDLAAATVYGQLVQGIPDLRTTTATILERIDRTVDRIRLLSMPVVSESPDSYWSVLTSLDKQGIEEAAAIRFPMASLDEVIADGRFVQCCNAEALSRIISERPSPFFDGIVFKPSLVHRQPAGRERIVGTVTRALLSLASFQQDDLMRQKHDIQLVQINLDVLDDQITDEGLLH